MRQGVTKDADAQDLFDGTKFAPRRKLIVARPRVKQRERIDPKLPRPKKPMRHYSEIECPCCSHVIGAPNFDVLVDYYDVPPIERAVLKAVWRGKGMPVPTERIFDAMYEDDPDGGPDSHKMYMAFKVALCRLRARLKGSGVTVENVGYRQGYRLILGEK